MLSACSTADAVLRRIERLARHRYLPIIGPVRGRILVRLVRRYRPRHILEVGTLLGYSTILMTKALGGEAEIVTIEVDEDEAERARENIRKAGVKPKVRVIVGDAMDIIPHLEEEFDLVFLDAAKNEYLSYLRFLEGKLLKGSLVIADNAGMLTHLMREYLDYVRNSGRYRSRFIPADGDGMEVSIKQ